jgi:acetylornithine deacetylase/succinyl-diaminopimelate desuccinylase-like protein
MAVDSTGPVIEWIKGQATGLKLEYKFFQDPENKEAFAIILTWPGTRADLESVFLSSHLDVVAVDKVSKNTRISPLYIN